MNKIKVAPETVILQKCLISVNGIRKNKEQTSGEDRQCRGKERSQKENESVVEKATEKISLQDVEVFRVWHCMSL